MKLISCYIEGYGALEKKEIIFEEGITAFCQENGTGKTTLASFIKAMFYGLKVYKSNSKDFCDREHFYPFKGGKFGGNLTFSYNGKTYKVERYFGEKSITGDTLKVYLDGELTNELGEEIGRTVFGVDEDSFMRTLFIGSEEIEIKSTSSINAKLGSFLHGMDEETGYDGALKRLDDARKSYQADRKGKNPTEFIPSTEKEIDGLRVEIDNAKRVQAALEGEDGKYARAETLKTEIAEMDRQIVEETKKNERRTLFERYEAMEESIADKERQAEEIRRRYPFGSLPTEEETLAVEESISKQKRAQAQLVTAEFSVADGQKLARLEECFVRGVPAEKELLEKEREVDELKAVETELAMLQSKEPTAREKSLAQKFMYGGPTEGEIAELSAKVEAYKQTKKDYEAISEWLPTAVAPTAKTSSRLFPLFAAVASILCAVGAVCFTMDKATLGILLLAVGGITLLVSGLLSFGGKSNTAQVATTSAVNPEKQRKETELRELEYSIKASLTRYGYHSDNGVVYDFAQLQDDAKEYAQYLEREQEKNRQLTEKQAKKQALEDGLTAFFRGYGLSGNSYASMLGDLRANLREYDSLRERKKTQAEMHEGLEKDLEEARIKVEAYKKKYGLTELSISDILMDIREERRLTAEMEKEKAQAAAFKEEKNLTEKPMGESVELGDLQAMRTEKQNELARLEREIDADESVAESVAEKEEMLKEAQTRLAAYKQKHKLLKAAKELLEKADGNLKDKYIKPIKDEFLYYAALLEKTLGEKVVMTKNFEIRFEREGEERSEKHLSAGQRSVCALCFRLALIKNMYKENPPFLILDDPFVNLDSAHMEKVKGVLQELCKEMQMVYFTCHESRVI